MGAGEQAEPKFWSGRVRLVTLYGVVAPLVAMNLADLVMNIGFEWKVWTLRRGTDEAVILSRLGEPAARLKGVCPEAQRGLGSRFREAKETLIYYGGYATVGTICLDGGGRVLARRTARFTANPLVLRRWVGRREPWRKLVECGLVRLPHRGR